MRILHEIIQGLNNERFAFLIGNGPNLRSNLMPSWKDLLSRIADPPISFDLEGLSNTEVYDLIELNSVNMAAPEDIKQKVCECLSLDDSSGLEIHSRLMSLAIDYDAPVLTTNFDSAFEDSIKAKIHHFDSKTFTRFYPWKSYYGLKPVESPTSSFGIWKIHGDVRYKDSIRLGLSDYMGSVERARKLIHNGENRLFRGKRGEHWQGDKTWLQIWFSMPLIIFGLGCNVDEIFIRWLLIERKRYFNIHNYPMKVYYVSKGRPAASICNLLKPLSVEIKIIEDYDDLYR